MLTTSHTLIYLSPNSNEEYNLALSNLIDQSEKNCLIIGDFNFLNCSFKGNSDHAIICTSISQNGFMMNLLQFLERVMSEVDGGNPVDILPRQSASPMMDQGMAD